PEGHVDARLHRAPGLGDAVKPVGLQLTEHQQERARAELKLCRLSRSAAGLEQEAPAAAEGQGGDLRPRAKARLIVAMPANAVGAIPIKVKQRAVDVKIQAGQLLVD